MAESSLLSAQLEAAAHFEQRTEYTALFVA
jgi:hypothetical protein